MYVFFEQPATYDQDIMIQIACYSSYTARVATTRVHMHVTKAEHTNSCFPPPPTCIYEAPLPRTVAQWQRDDTSSCFLLICVMLLISERVRTFMYSSSIVTYIILYFPLCVFFVFALGLTSPPKESRLQYLLDDSAKECCRVSNQVRDCVWKSWYSETRTPKC